MDPLPGRAERPAVTDLALAAERTRLSWRRTVLSALAVMLLAVSKLVLTAPTPGAIALICLMLLSWLALISVARRRMTALRDAPARPVGRSPGLVALLVAGYAVLAILLIP